MSFQYHGQMLHGLNRYNLLVGLEIPDLRIPNYYIPAQDMYGYELCEENNKPETRYVLMFGQLFKQLLGRLMT